jgi:hypothetical protein
MKATLTNRPQVIGYRFFHPNNGSVVGSASARFINSYKDMLRYDHAFLSLTAAGVPVVAFVTYRVKGQGVYQGVPAFDRWRSFGVRLDEDVPHGDLHTHITKYPGQWKTYVHPRIDGRPDYGQLVEFTLADFLAGKES